MGRYNVTNQLLSEGIPTPTQIIRKNFIGWCQDEDVTGGHSDDCLNWKWIGENGLKTGCLSHPESPFFCWQSSPLLKPQTKNDNRCWHRTFPLSFWLQKATAIYVSSSWVNFALRGVLHIKLSMFVCHLTLLGLLGLAKANASIENTTINQRSFSKNTNTL